jgi:integrase/recombinase XerC
VKGSTFRRCRGCLRQFTEFLTDARYGWVAGCEREFGPGNHPVAICHGWNTIAHLNDYEGDPEARPFVREEMQRFLDYADDQVDRVARSKRKGTLAAYRDATLFKVMYGWKGLRRTETSRLDMADWGGIRRYRSSAGTGCCMSGSGRLRAASRRGGGTLPR